MSAIAGATGKGLAVGWYSQCISVSVGGRNLGLPLTLELPWSYPADIVTNMDLSWYIEGTRLS